MPIPVNVVGSEPAASYWFVSSTSVRTVSGTNWPNLRKGLYYEFAASGEYKNNAIVMHEMAHHFTLDVRVPENPASTGCCAAPSASTLLFVSSQGTKTDLRARCRNAAICARVTGLLGQ